MRAKVAQIDQIDPDILCILFDDMRGDLPELAERQAAVLHLRGVRDRPASLRRSLAGHAVNPMNQAWLSRIPIMTLTESYALGARYHPVRSFEAACRRLCGEALGKRIVDEVTLFRDQGLAGMAEARRRALIEAYGGFAGSPYAAELRAWLDGAYAFDPDCLTD